MGHQLCIKFRQKRNPTGRFPDYRKVAHGVRVLDPGFEFELQRQLKNSHRNLPLLFHEVQEENN